MHVNTADLAGDMPCATKTLSSSIISLYVRSGMPCEIMFIVGRSSCQILHLYICTHQLSHFHDINPRRACATRVTVRVYLLIKSHLTSGASVRPENTAMYSAGNRGKKNVGFCLKLLHCRDTPAASCHLYGYRAVGMRIISVRAFSTTAHAWRRRFCTLVLHASNIENL